MTLPMWAALSLALCSTALAYALIFTRRIAKQRDKALERAYFEVGQYVMLKKEHDQVVRERDAAVWDIKYLAFTPEVCKHYKYCQTIDAEGDKGCFGPLCCEDYAWRGLCDENTKERDDEV